MSVPLRNRYGVLSDLQGEGESGQQVRINDRNRIQTDSFKLTKKYFKLLQATHHSEILNRDFQERQLPPGMTRQVQKLTKFIKPACPTASTTSRVSKMTHSWMKEILKILLEHYDSTISSLLDEPEPFDLEAFEKAIKWAKSRYGRKLTPSSIDTAKNLLQPELRQPTNVPMPLTSSPLIPMVSNQRPIIAEVLHQQDDPLVGTSSSGLGAPQLASVVVPNEPQCHPTGDGVEQVSNDVASPQATFQTPEQSAPKKHTQKTKNKLSLSRRRNSVNHTLNSSNSNSSLSLVPSEGEGPEPRPADKRELDIETGMIEPPRRVMTETTVGGQSESTSFPQSNGQGPSGHTPPLFHPTRHTKGKDWRLNISKPIVILGDSNLSRIPPFPNANIQVNSFPGAAFHHLIDLITPLEPQPDVEVLIISAGIINCLNWNKNLTTWKQFQELFRTCRVRFPQALIYIAQITYSRLLDTNSIECIMDFNRRVQEKCQHSLPPLNEELFRVNTRDKIHWTKKTAERMFQHWLDCLN